MIKPRCCAFQQDDCENEFIYDDSVRDKVQKNERSVEKVKFLSVNEVSHGIQWSGEEVWDTMLGFGYGYYPIMLPDIVIGERFKSFFSLSNLWEIN